MQNNILKELAEENKCFENELYKLQQHQNNLNDQLKTIKTAKAYKFWQKLNRIKKVFSDNLRQFYDLLKILLNPLKIFSNMFYYKYLEFIFLLKLKTNKYKFLTKNGLNNCDVSILVPTFGSTKNLDVLLNSIEKNPDNLKYEILICNDNPSAIKKIDYWFKINEKFLKKHHVSIISASNNLGFVSSINKLSEISNGKYLLFLNDDIEIISKNWLSSLVKTINNPKVKITGSFLIYPNKNYVQHAGMYPFLKSDNKFYNYHFFKFFNPNFYAIKTTNVFMVTGASLLIRKDDFFKYGKLDYHYLGAGGFDDSDLCNKVIKSGYKICFVKESMLIHYEGNTIRHLNKWQNLIFKHNHNYYNKKWNIFLKKQTSNLC